MHYRIGLEHIKLVRLGCGATRESWGEEQAETVMQNQISGDGLAFVAIATSWSSFVRTSSSTSLGRIKAAN